jgi:hypothetical protein
MFNLLNAWGVMYPISSLAFLVLLFALAWILRTEDGARTVASFLFLNYRKFRIAFIIIFAGDLIYTFADIFLYINLLSSQIANIIYATGMAIILLGFLYFITALVNKTTMRNENAPF